MEYILKKTSILNLSLPEHIKTALFILLNSHKNGEKETYNYIIQYISSLSYCLLYLFCFNPIEVLFKNTQK